MLDLGVAGSVAGVERGRRCEGWALKLLRGQDARKLGAAAVALVAATVAGLDCAAPTMLVPFLCDVECCEEDLFFFLACGHAVLLVIIVIVLRLCVLCGCLCKRLFILHVGLRSTFFVTYTSWCHLPYAETLKISDSAGANARANHKQTSVAVLAASRCARRCSAAHSVETCQPPC